MSGILVAATGGAAAAGSRYVITVAGNPAQYGYGQPSLGSISPNSLLRGLNMTTISAPRSGFDNFLLVISGSAPAQNFFNRVAIQGFFGYTTLTSASASYSTDGASFSQWTWGDGADPIWVVGDVGQLRQVTFHF
jgi:hypothetical protein